jgi:homocitrate synthase NifV
LRGLSSSQIEWQITDATLCGLELSGVDSRYISQYYRKALELGVTYVQIPVKVLDMLEQDIVSERTILKVHSDCTAVPLGFAGYLSTDSDMPGRIICECAFGVNPPPFADEIRWIADYELFFDDYTSILELLVSEFRYGFCPRSAGDLGTSLAVEWLLLGGRSITASFMGMGGYAPIEEIIAALYVYGLLPESVKPERLPSLSEAYRKLTKQPVPAHKAVIGSALFDVESGIHVDGIMKKRQCYEPFAPEIVGARRRFVIGKHTGKKALKIKLHELGLYGQYDLEQLLILVREESMLTGGSLEDRTIYGLAKCVKEVQHG